MAAGQFGAARQARAGAEIPSARFGVIFELMIVIGSRDSLLSIKVKKVNRTVSLH